MEGKKKLQVLTLEKRIGVIRDSENGLSQRILAAKYNCGKTQIHKTIANRKRYLDEWESNANKEYKRKRKCVYETVNGLVWEWFQTSRANGVPISGPMIQEKAREYALTLGNSTLTASNGWLESFRKRHCLVYRTLGSQSFDVDILTEDAVDCGVCDDISLSATETEHDPESVQTNDENETESFLNVEMVTCENDSLGKEAAFNTNSFKRYSAEEMMRLTGDAVDCGVCDDISLSSTETQHEPEFAQTNDENQTEGFLNVEIVTCENDSLGEEAASNTSSFKCYSAEEMISQRSLKRPYNSRFDQDTWNLQNEMKAHSEKEDNIMKKLLQAVSDAIHWWILEINYKGEVSCENKDCDQAFKNEVDMFLHWLCCRLTIYYPSFGLFKMNEGEDSILPRKGQMAKELKTKWPARQSQESLAAIHAADAAAHQDSRARETLEQSQARRNASAAALRNHRARETLEQSQARRNADAAGRRNRRARETLEQSQARRNADATAHRNRRARETLEQSQARRNAAAAGRRNRRAQETLEQSQARRNADAAAHRNRRARKVGVEQHNCGPMNIISQFCNLRNFAAGRPSDGNFTSFSKLQSVSSSVSTDAISENVLSQMTAVTSDSDSRVCVTANGAAVDNSCLVLKPAISFEPDLYENEKQYEEVLLPHSLSEAKQLTASTEDSELCTFSEGATKAGSDCRSQVITSVGSCSSRTSPLSVHTNTDNFRLMLKSEIKVEPGILESDQEPDKISNDDFCS